MSICKRWIAASQLVANKLKLKPSLGKANKINSHISTFAPGRNNQQNVQPTCFKSVCWRGFVPSALQVVNHTGA